VKLVRAAIGGGKRGTAEVLKSGTGGKIFPKDGRGK